MLARAIEKHAAWAAAISCSGFDPGPSSKRDLYVYPPLIVSPALNVPVPVGMSPFHSALPFAGMVASFDLVRLDVVVRVVTWEGRVVVIGSPLRPEGQGEPTKTSSGLVSWSLAS